MKFIKENIHLAMNDNVSSLTEFENLSKIKKDTHATHVWLLDILLSYCL